jgi:hypothetical protein
MVCRAILRGALRHNALKSFGTSPNFLITLASGPMERQISNKCNNYSAEYFVSRVRKATNNTNILAGIGDAFHHGARTVSQTGSGHARHFPFVSRHQTSLSVAQIDVAQNQRLKTDEGFDSSETYR